MPPSLVFPRLPAARLLAGLSVRFLQAVILVSPAGDVVVRPHFGNMAFVRGEEDAPHKATLTPFYSPLLSSPMTLQSYLFGKLLAFNYVSQGSLSLALREALCVILECILLHWHPRAIGICLRRLPRRVVAPALLRPPAGGGVKLTRNAST